MAFFETEEEKREKERKHIEKTLEKYNVFEGIKCEAVLPEKQLKTSGKSGATKGLATFAKNANMDGSDLRIPYGEIVRMIVPEDDEAQRKGVGIITLLKNKQILLSVNGGTNNRLIIINHISKILNERAFGIKNEEPGWGLVSEYEGNKLSYDGSDISNLERISVMYEKGLLSEEEFNKLKKGIIEK